MIKSFLGASGIWRTNKSLKNEERSAIREDLLPAEVLSYIFTLILEDGAWAKATWPNLRLVSYYWKNVLDHLPQWSNGARYLAFSRSAPMSQNDLVFMRGMTLQVEGGFGPFHSYMWRRSMVPFISEARLIQNHSKMFLQKVVFLRLSEDKEDQAFQLTNHGLKQLGHCRIRSTHNPDLFLSLSPLKKHWNPEQIEKCNRLDILLLLDDNNFIAAKYSLSTRFTSYSLEPLRLYQIKELQHFYPPGSSSEVESDSPLPEYSIFIIATQSDPLADSSQIHIFNSGKQKIQTSLVYMSAIADAPACIDERIWQEAILSNLSDALEHRFAENYRAFQATYLMLKEEVLIFYVLFDSTRTKLLCALAILVAPGGPNLCPRTFASPVFCGFFSVITSDYVFAQPFFPQPVVHHSSPSEAGRFNMREVTSLSLAQIQRLHLDFQFTRTERDLILKLKGKRRRESKEVDRLLESVYKDLGKAASSLIKLKTKLSQIVE